MARRIPLVVRRRVGPYVVAALTTILLLLAGVASAAGSAAASPRRFEVVGATRAHGAYDVDRTYTYQLFVRATHRPHYVDAAPFPERPSGGYFAFERAGRHRWTFDVRIDDAMRSHRYWNIGVRIDHTVHRIRLRVFGPGHIDGGPGTTGSGPHQG